MSETLVGKDQEVPLNAPVVPGPDVSTLIPLTEVSEQRGRQPSVGLIDVDIVIPVFNEEKDLESSVRRLREYLDSSFPFTSQITIADNGSTDGTHEIASRLAGSMEGVQLCSLSQKGRGRALRAAWSQSVANVVAYMDVDLSTGLDALLPLVAPLLSGHSDLSIGTRLAQGSFVVRGPKREVISRSYNLIVRAFLHNGFSDAQCGFKAMKRGTAMALLPLVVDNDWFFDTELLVLAERNGLRIYEVPVDWVDDTDSKVHVWRTAIGDLKGLSRLIREFNRGGGRLSESSSVRSSEELSQLGRFARVGTFSTVAYFLLFFLVAPLAGVYWANLLVLAVCTAANIGAHGRFTFAAHGPVRVVDALYGGSLIFATNVIATTLALLSAAALAPNSSIGRVFAILIGTGVAAFVRFVLLQAWVFRKRER